MQIFNYTGKYITVSGEHGIRETLPPDVHAKTTIKHSKKTVVGFVTIFKREYGRIENLPSPDPRREKLYIVNQDVACVFRSILYHHSAAKFTSVPGETLPSIPLESLPLIPG